MTGATFAISFKGNLTRKQRTVTITLIINKEKNNNEKTVIIELL